MNFVNQLCSKNLSKLKATNDFHQYFYFSQRTDKKRSETTFLSGSQQPSLYLRNNISLSETYKKGK